MHNPEKWQLDAAYAFAQHPERTRIKLNTTAQPHKIQKYLKSRGVVIDWSGKTVMSVLICVSDAEDYNALEAELNEKFGAEQNA